MSRQQRVDGRAAAALASAEPDALTVPAEPVRSAPATGSVSAVKLAMAAVSGAAIAATFLDFRLYPLAWIAFVPLLWALGDARSRRETIWIGLVGGLATNLPAFHWLVYTMGVFGGFPWIIAAFFYAILSTYSACQFVLLALGLRRTGFGPLALAPAFLWTTLEFLYPNLFPWKLANSQFHAPVLTQIGDVTGPWGLSFAMLWTQSALVCFLKRRSAWPPLAAASALTLAIVGYGLVRMPQIQAAIDAAPLVKAGLVQGNVGIREKGNVSYFDINLRKYTQLSRSIEDDVDVLVWPETVSQEWVPTSLDVLPEEINPFPGARKPLVYGGLAFTETGPHQYLKYNAAFLLAPGGDILGRYEKQILLPFGEYLPGSSLLPFITSISPQTGDFTAGNRMVTLDVPGKLRIAPLICYEDVPVSMARDMTRAGAEVLLTMFNDAWFGNSVAPYQHEALALWRAIENRRYFLRVGNAGVTGLVDPFGRVLNRLGMFTGETMVAEVRPLHITSFYTRFGNVFGWTVVLLTAALLVRKRSVAPSEIKS